MSDQATDEEIEQRLAATFVAVAAVTPTPDRSAELLERLRDIDRNGSATDAPLIDLAEPRRTSRNHRPRILLAAAAVVVLLAAAVAVNTAGDRGEGTVATAPAEPSGAGWFLPPDGWTVTSVDTDYLDVGFPNSCPCTLWAAGRVADSAAVEVFESGLPDEDDTGTGSVVVDVGGREGAWRTDGEARVLFVANSTHHVAIVSRGVDLPFVTGLADAWLDQRDADSESDVNLDLLDLPSGFVRTEPEVTAATFEHIVIVRVREDATGRVFEYQLSPSGFNRYTLFLGELLGFDDGKFTVGHEGEQDGFVAFVGGPVDIVVGLPFFGDPVSVLTSTERTAFAAGLQPASTSDWREALSTSSAVVDPLVLSAPSLFEAPLTG